MKYYTYNGVTTTELPQILRIPGGSISPVTEADFVQYGGEITEDEKLTPVEAFMHTIGTYLEALEEELHDAGIVITVDEFKDAARTKMSTDLIDWAREKHVPEDVIVTVRQKMLELIADASRLGLTWNDIFKD
jgi:hypothetical protein